MPRDRRYLIGICLTQGCLISSITSFVTSIAAISADLHVTPQVAAIAGSAYGIAFGGLSIYAPTGRKWLGASFILAIGAAVWIIASIALLLSNDISIFVAARFIQGTAAAILAPCLVVVLRDERGPKFFDFMPIWGIVSPVGALIGVVGSAFSIWAGDWRFAQYALSLAMIAATLSIFCGRRIVATPEDAPSLPLHAILFPMLIIALYAALSFGAWDMKQSAILACLLCFGLAVLFCVSESRQVSRKVFGIEVLCPSGHLTATLWLLVSPGILSCFFFVISPFTESQFQTPEKFLAFVLPFGAALIGTSLLAERWDRGQTDSSRLNMAAYVMASAFLLSAWQTQAVERLWVISALGVTCGAAISVVFSVTTKRYFTLVPKNAAEKSGVVCNMAFEIGPAVAVPIYLMAVRGTLYLENGNMYFSFMDVLIFMSTIVIATLPAISLICRLYLKLER
ncbi:MFS transporter [Aureimonas ureilytica]|nr:MFS transporter [Aureimonas ureilytica]